MSRRVLTPAEDATIRKAHAGEISIRECARALKCSFEIIYRRWDELRLPRRRPSRLRPAGLVKDCCTCRYWTAGTIVLRGNTIGQCSQLDQRVGADEWCEMHDEGEGQ